MKRLCKALLLDLDVCLGEGSSAARFMGIGRSAAACPRDMSTFFALGADNNA